MVSNNGFALLVGVDDYSSFDAGFNLKGSRQDVLKLYWFTRQILGLSPENIRVLASPPLTADEFYMTSAPPAEMMGEATQGSIQAGIQWLAERMAQNGGVPGLLTFSGHGSYAPDRGALLCPADIEKDLAKGIAVRDLSKSDALQKVRERLTVVLDCCHHAPAAPAPELRIHTALPHDATPEQIAADHADFDISERVLLAARPGQYAHQALLGKVWHGALTFALVTVAEQWKASQGPGTPGLHVSYKQLRKRVRKLHSALRMRQSARLRVPLEKRKAIRKLPFFGVQAGLTTRKPDAERNGIQLDPTENGWCLYTITGIDGLQILSVGPAVGDYSENTEYWSIPKNVSLPDGTITFMPSPAAKGEAPTGFPAPTECVAMPSLPTWPHCNSLPPTPKLGVYFRYSDYSGGNLDHAIALDLTNLSSGQVTWYRYGTSTSSGPTNQYAIYGTSSSGIPFTSDPGKFPLKAAMFSCLTLPLPASTNK